MVKCVKMFQKGAFFLAIFIFVWCFFSCANFQKNEGEIAQDSLKAQAEKLYNDTFWVSEIEKERLTRDISSIETVDKGVRISPQVLINSTYSKNLASVYPSLEGFTSLDLTNFLPEVKSLTKEFSIALCEGQIKDSIFESEDIFEAALFFNDLQEEWFSAFDEEFPLKGGDFEEESNSKTDEHKISPEKLQASDEKSQSGGEKSDLQSDLKKDDKSEVQADSKVGEKKLAEKNETLFSSFVIGCPYEMNGLYEVPVRFLREKRGYVDVMIFFIKKSDSWKINQLHILKMDRGEKL